MNYVTAVITQFTIQEAKEVVIKARGKFMARAIDVSNVAKKRFMEEIEFKDVLIGSETFKPEGTDREVTVSTIDIILVRKLGNKILNKQ